MVRPKLTFKDQEEKKQYVQECEDRFEARLDEVMKELCDRDELRFLTLSGPSCSGKTTASKKLISEFAERGKKVKIISLDDFFRDREELVEEANGGKLDFDSEKALDIDALARFMDDLRSGRTAMLPRFDFNAARRVSTEPFNKGDADVIVFEGIQAIYPVFTELLGHDKQTASVYISPLEDMDVDGHIIVPTELRLWRRLVRDYYFRSAEPEFSFLLWESVRDNEDKNILPYADRSEYMINSVLGYDVGMLREPLEEVLSRVSRDSKYYKKACEILDTVSKADAISRELLPENSLYFEFV